MYGEGIAEDKTEAVKWLRNSAEQGYSEAQCVLGACYECGWGIEQDNREAVKWYRKAVEQGHDIAQQSLDRIMNYVLVNCRKAAEQGDPQAQFNLGCLYMRGKDITEPLEYFQRVIQLMGYLHTTYRLALGETAAVALAIEDVLGLPRLPVLTSEPQYAPK